MGKNPPHFICHLLFGPIRMLVLEKCGFVAARGPIEMVRGQKPLFRRHATKYLKLFWTGRFIGQH
jgi:hypothetical protein